MEKQVQPAKEPIVWLTYPLRPHKPVGTFSSDLRIINALFVPVPLPSYRPDQQQLVILRRHFPDADPAKPPWETIRAYLAARRVQLPPKSNTDSRELIEILQHIPSEQPPKGGRPKGTAPKADNIRKAIERDPLASDSDIALRCRASTKYVAQVRRGTIPDRATSPRESGTK